MDDPPSEGNERVAEIFIVSTDETVTVPLKEHLEQTGHQVTVLTDDAQLNEILPKRKPCLLICDGTSGEGYEFIRRIKAEDGLWAIPVLVLTTASTMEALLQVLASNADNFIAPPYNSPDHLSIIENMIATPIERPIPGDLNKLFRVREDDQTYVITATSRKLLEYLLSSFEVVVGKSSELSSAMSNLQKLSESTKNLEQTVTGQSRDIEVLNMTVQQKEQVCIASARECEELKKALTQKTEEIKNLAEESDNKKTTLDTMENALMEEETRNASLEKELRDLRSELGQHKNTLAAEKTRSLSAEQEISSLKQAKEQSEHDLKKIITGQTRDIEELNTIVQEKEHKNTALTLECEKLKKTSEQITNEIKKLKKESAEKKTSLETVQNSLTEEKTRSASLEKTIRDLKSELEQQNSALVSEKNLSVLAEQGINALGQEKTQSEREMGQIIIGLNETVQQHVTEISRLKVELESEIDRRVLAENHTGELQRKLESQNTTRSDYVDLNMQEAPANERKGHLELHEGHTDTTKERHLVQQSLFSPDENNSREEDLGLVILEAPHLPISVPQVSLPVTGKSTPGLPQHPGSTKDPAAAGSAGETPRIFSGVIPRVSGISDADSLFLESEPAAKNADPGQGTTKVNRPAKEQKIQEYFPEKTTSVDDEEQHLAPVDDAKREKKVAERSESSGKEAGSRRQSVENPAGSVGAAPVGEISLTRSQWLDLLKWARHTETMSEDERLRIVRMGRLVQKDGKLGKKQQDLVREILSSAYALGYHSR